MLGSARLPQRVLLVVKPLVAAAQASAQSLFQMLIGLLRDEMSYDVRPVSSGKVAEAHVAQAAGPGIWPAVVAEAGIHVWCRFHENLLPIGVWIHPRDERTAEEQRAALQEQRRDWLARMAAGEEGAPDPWPIGKIVRFYDENGATLDLRTGLKLRSLPEKAEHKRLLLAGMTLPPEMEA